MDGMLKFSAISLVSLFLFSNILLACTPDENFCDNDILNQCIGGVWSSISCADTGEVCIGSGILAGCSASVPAGCIENTFQCSPTDPNTRQFCQNGQWLDYDGCLYGCDYSTNTCKACADNTFRCSPTDSNTRQTCSNGNWLDYESCIYGCDYSSLTGQCKPNPTVVGCIDGTFRCSPTVDNQRDRCSNNMWIGYESCSIGCNQLTGSCISPECTSLENFCNGNILTQCVNGKWETKSCVAEGKVCTGIALTAACTAAPSGGSGRIVGESGIAPEDYSSGGGEVKKCTSWSEWYINKSSTKIEKDGTNSRECTDETLRRYCYLSTGVLDFSHYETNENYECGEWSGADKCDYVFESSQAYTDTSGEKCRTCERSTYAYACQPSGKTDYSNTKQSTTCSSWRQCTPEEVAGTTVSPSRSDIDALLEDYGLVIGAVVAVLLLVVLFATYKMFSTPEDES